jgi:hypothetical protein
VTLDPAAYRGQQFIAADNRPVFSIGTEWRRGVDVADVIRVQPELLELTVGDGGDYQLLSEALRAASSYLPGHVKQAPSVNVNKWCVITILGGTVIDEQIEITAPMQGVFIHSEDEVVDVDVSGFQNVSAAEGAPFLRYLGAGTAPTIGTVFREVARPSGLSTIGISSFSTRFGFGRADDPVDIVNLPNGHPLLPRRGLEGFAAQVTMRGAWSECNAGFADFLNPTDRCFVAFTAALISCRGVRMKGWGINAIRLDARSQAGWQGTAGDMRTTFNGFAGTRNDFRQDTTVSNHPTTSDIQFSGGGDSRWVTPNDAFFAGFNIPLNALTNGGRVQIGAGVLNWGGAPVQTSRRATVAGTANALAISTDTGLHASPATGLQIRFRASAANTGAATIALDGGTAIACRTITGAVLPAGYIRTDADTVARYDGTHWILDRAAERGSNANGSWVRYADGKQECRLTAFDIAFSQATHCQSNWTYPAEFIAQPAISGVVNQNGSSLSGGPLATELGAIHHISGGGAETVAALRVNKIPSGASFVSGNHVRANMTAQGAWYA